MRKCLTAKIVFIKIMKSRLNSYKKDLRLGPFIKTPYNDCFIKWASDRVLFDLIRESG